MKWRLQFRTVAMQNPLIVHSSQSPTLTFDILYHVTVQFNQMCLKFHLHSSQTCAPEELFNILLPTQLRIELTTYKLQAIRPMRSATEGSIPNWELEFQV